MNLLFVAAQLLALIRLLLAKYPYRWFLIALSLWCVQAVNTSYFPGKTREWTATCWMYPEIALVLTTAAACIETIERERSRLLPVPALALRVASIGFSGAIMAIGWKFILIPQGDALSTFLAIRVWGWAFMMVYVGVAALLIRLNESRSSLHTILLLGIVSAHVLISPLWDAPNNEKLLMRLIYRVIVIASCFIWALAVKPALLRRESAPSV